MYTNVYCDGDRIAYRGYVDGKRVQKKVKYKPKLFIESNVETEWKSIDRKNVQVVDSITGILSARGFVKKYNEISGFKIYGNQRYEYAFLGELFTGDVKIDSTLIRTAYIDIEVDSENGYPSIEEATSAVTAITIFMNGQYNVYGLQDYEVKQDNVTYHQFEDEESLMTAFIDAWAEMDIDVVTGWNVKGFDIPYLINRTTRLFGIEATFRFSPWGKVSERRYRLGKKELQVYEVAGIAILDYLDLYKKFAPTPNRESYKLDYIGEVELNVNKLPYEQMGYKDLNDFYQRNFQEFINYNIRDVEIVIGLEKKLKLVMLATTMAYYAKVNYEDVFFQTRMWDMIIFNKLLERKVAIPPGNDNPMTKEIEGAYVKESSTGRFRWVVSFDLTSLYPHLAMMYNISNETLLEPQHFDADIIDWLKINRSSINVDSLLYKNVDLSILKDKQLTITPNGQLFRTGLRGLGGEMMADMFALRKKTKDHALKLKREAESFTGEEKAQKLQESVEFDTKQSAIKVSLNSWYGASGNPGFRYYDPRVAEAITMAGQLSIRWIQKAINKYLNKILKEEEEFDFVLMSDTDSIFINLEPLVNKAMPGTNDPKKVVDFLNKVCVEKLQPFIDNSFQELADYVSAYEQKMIMKREKICDQVILTAKKRYILSVYDNEGVVYAEPEVKITGLEAIKSSTPKLCKAMMKKAIKICLTGSEEQVMEFVNKSRAEFAAAAVADIAFPRGISDLEKYKDNRNIYILGTPIHVKGALLYNHLLQSHNLDKKIEPIREKDKIKFVYLKSKNPFNSNCLAFHDKIPKEFDAERFIDRELQFEKTFIEPFQIISKAIGWKLEPTNSLDDFFS